MVRAIALLFLACAASAQQVRVLTYNIHHGEGMDGKIDLDRIAAVIRSVKPDLVALQEVDRKTGRSYGVDQAAELARLTGLQMIFGRTIDFDGGQYGNTVLARIPIDRSENHSLPGNEPRSLIQIDTQAFTFFATHLDAARDDAKRLEAVVQINRKAEAVSRPMLLAGDLNSAPGSAAAKALSELWSIAGTDRSLPTFPGRQPARQIDYILYRPTGRWQVVELRVLDEPLASDHRPLFAVLVCGAGTRARRVETHLDGKRASSLTASSPGATPSAP